MYEEIFEDVRKVEQNLIEAGVKNIDETKIFNLLETLQSAKVVTQILVESRELNDSQSGGLVSGSNVFAASSDFLDDHNESDVEVIKEVRKEDKVRATVDLTDTPDDYLPTKVEEIESQETEANWNESVAEDSNEDSNADDSMNQNDCSNDSDVENYYTTSDYEEIDSNKKEIDKTKADSPPPILSILKDLCENPKLTEEPAQPAFEVIREVENLEILEENNNDPNNNNDLEEVQLVEQPRPRSPVAGCSRDFDEREPRKRASPILSGSCENFNISHPKPHIQSRYSHRNNCQDNMEPQPSCSTSPILSGSCENFSISHPKPHIQSRYSHRNNYQDNMEPQPSCSTELTNMEVNDDEIEEISRKSCQTNYEKLLKETEAINRLFPDMSGDMIFSMLDKIKKATNRVAIVLWDLLPRERPEPNFPKKRKRDNDPCPANHKKASPSLPSSKCDKYINADDLMNKEVRDRMNQIKPLSSLPSSKIDYSTIKKIQRDVRSVEKRDSSEIDTSAASNMDEFLSDQSLTDLETQNHQNKESPKGKGKSLIRPCVIQPGRLNFQSKSTPKIETKPSQKFFSGGSILAPPKLIISPTKKESEDTNLQQAAPTRKLTSPTRELTEEGFVAEGIESVNTASNIPVLESEKVRPEKLKSSRAETSQSVQDVKSKNVEYQVEQNDKDALRIKSKKSKNLEEVNNHPPVIKVRTDLIPSDQSDLIIPSTPLNPEPVPVQGFKIYKPQLPAPGIQNQDGGSRFTPVNNKPDKELENLLNQYLPNEQLVPAPTLDFLKPNRVNQFYQMPRMGPPVFKGDSAQTQKIYNSSMPSTSGANLLRSPQPPQPIIVPGTSTSNSVIKKLLKDSLSPYKETYYKLRGIFPDVDPEFIKDKCINPPFDNKDLSKSQMLNMLVEVLLNDGSNHHQVLEIKEESVDMGNKDEQYENLLGIFPEADPTYLRDFVDKNYTNPESLKDFVQINLENPTYPTREQFLKKVKITEQIKEYTTDFNIKKFLQIFPEPVEHFENPERTSEYNAMVYEFLKDVFCKFKVVTISQIYRKRKYHLSLTASELRSMSPDMKGKRNCNLIPTENIPLLQEMAYVRHKKEIVAYLEKIKKDEEKEFEDLRAKGMLLECQCCFSDEVMPSKCSSCEKGHLFCHSCILRGAQSKMGDGQNHIACFASCDSEFSLSVLQEVLPPTTFSILLQKRQEAEVMAAGLEGLVSCPFCHFASIPPSESKVFKCLNPECMKETCRLCKELNHVPLRCDEVMKADQARLHLEEKMTEALVRTCYQCQKPFFKEEGCNKMTCVCGASMCYLCSTPLKKGDYTHFNGQGSTSLQLCPLWSDNRRMNAEAVRKVAEVTEKEIRKKNPNLKINSNAILPSLPPKTRGPHDDIPNANALPEYVLRVANINP